MVPGYIPACPSAKHPCAIATLWAPPLVHPDCTHAAGAKGCSFLRYSVISFSSGKLNPTALNTAQPFRKTASWKEAGEGSVPHIQPHYSTLLGSICWLLGCHQETVKLLVQCLHSHFPLFFTRFDPLNLTLPPFFHSLAHVVTWFLPVLFSITFSHLFLERSWRFFWLLSKLNPKKTVANSCKRNCLKEERKCGHSLPYILYLLPHPPYFLQQAC